MLPEVVRSDRTNELRRQTALPLKGKLISRTGLDIPSNQNQTALCKLLLPPLEAVCRKALQGVNRDSGAIPCPKISVKHYMSAKTSTHLYSVRAPGGVTLEDCTAEILLVELGEILDAAVERVDETNLLRIRGDRQRVSLRGLEVHGAEGSHHGVNFK